MPETTTQNTTAASRKTPPAPPDVSASMKKIRKPAKYLKKIPLIVKLAFAAVLFAVFGIIAWTVSVPEKKLDYEVLAQSFVSKSAQHTEVMQVSDNSNFGKSSSSAYVPRLPHNVFINPNRMDLKAYLPKKTTTSSNSSSSSSSSSSKTEDKTTANTTDKSEDKENTVAGYAPGQYVLEYDMNVRANPGMDASVKTELKKGSKVTISKIVQESDGSVWGQTGSGCWICIQDANMTYLK